MLKCHSSARKGFIIVYKASRLYLVSEAFSLHEEEADANNRQWQ